MKGHIGEDHGLVSNMFIDMKSGNGFTFAINGCLNPYKINKNISEFYTVVHELHVLAQKVLCINYNEYLLS